MGFHHLIYIIQSQAETCNTIGSIAPVDRSPFELVEYMVLCSKRNTDPVVFYLDLCELVIPAGSDLYFDRLPGVFDRIVYQVADRLLQIFFIRKYIFRFYV